MFRRRRLSLAVSDSWNMTYSRLLTTTLSSLMLTSKHLWLDCTVQHLFTSSVSYLHCALASSAVYCSWSCLWVCLWVCYHNNSKLHASILTKLSLQVSAVQPFWVGGPQGRAPKARGSRCQRCGEGVPQKTFWFLSSKWRVLVHSWCKNYYIRTVVCKQHICIICYYFLIKTLRYL